MDLFKRHPRFCLHYREQEPLVEDTGKYPALTADFKLLDDILMPLYHQYNKEALHLQNAHWWTYVILIVGGAIATICGILQLAFNVDAFGIMGAIVATVLGSTTLVLNSFHYQERYMDTRLAAERLRGEYFLFLGHLGQYKDGDQERIEKLKESVLMIAEKAEV